MVRICKWNLLLIAAAVLACSPGMLHQENPRIALPLAPPELEITTDRQRNFLDETRSLLRLDGKLVDRRDVGNLLKTRDRYPALLLKLELTGAASEDRPVEEPGDEVESSTISLSVPFDVRPVLRIGQSYSILEEVVQPDPLSLPQTRFTIYNQAGSLVYYISTGGRCPENTPLDGLTLNTSGDVAYITDFEAYGGCRMRRKHFDTVVLHLGIDMGSALLHPGDDVDITTRDKQRYKISILDNSTPLPGECPDMIAQELAHCTLIIKRLD